MEIGGFNMKIIAKENYLFDLTYYAKQTGGYKVPKGSEWICLSKLNGVYTLQKKGNCLSVIQVNENTLMDVFELVGEEL